MNESVGSGIWRIGDHMAEVAIALSDIEYILDFVVKLGRHMLRCGANLERVNDTMYRICLSYHLNRISIFSLSSTLIVSAKSPDNIPCTRHISVPQASIYLAKLSRYNQLSREICADPPNPECLADLLREADSMSEYSLWSVVGGYALALSCLCGIFGGSFRDMLAAALITLALFPVIQQMRRQNLNRILMNVICMWLAASLAIGLVKIGLAEHGYTLIITLSLLLVPGIYLVNAVRSILCGNEMNGIIELLKVLLEAVAIACGLYIGLRMFGGMIQWTV